MAKNMKEQNYPTPSCIQALQEAWKQMGGKTCFKKIVFPPIKVFPSSYDFIYNTSGGVDQDKKLY